jgi:hypothetical protein
VLRVSDCVCDGIWPGIPEPTEWQRIGDEIDASFIFAGAQKEKNPSREGRSNPQSNPFTSLTTFSLAEVRLFDMIEVHASNQSKPYSVTL